MIGLAATAWLLSFWLTGVNCIRLLKRHVRLIEALALGFGIGAGIFSLSMFLLSWAGVKLTALSMILLMVFLNAVLQFTLWLRYRLETNAVHNSIPVKTSLAIIKQNWLATILWAVVLLLIAAAFKLSIGLSYHSWDAMALWGAKGYGIAKEGTILAGTGWGNKRLYYPMNIFILIGSFQLLGLESLPGSKLIFPAFYASLTFSSYYFLRARNLKPTLSVLGTLLLASTPLIFEHARIGYANLAFAYYLAAGMIWLSQGLQTNNNGNKLNGGILLAFALWTRPEGLILWGTLMAGLFLYLFWNRLPFRDSLYAILPGIMVAIPWKIFQKLHWQSVVESSVLEIAIKKLLSGELNKTVLVLEVRYFLGQILDLDVWGFFIPIASLFAGIYFLRNIHKRNNDSVMLLILAAIILAMDVFAMYYTTAYDTSNDLDYWLATGFNRMLMPAAILGGLSGVASIIELVQQQPSTE